MSRAWGLRFRATFDARQVLCISRRGPRQRNREMNRGKGRERRWKKKRKRGRGGGL